MYIGIHTYTYFILVSHIYITRDAPVYPPEELRARHATRNTVAPLP